MFEIIRLIAETIAKSLSISSLTKAKKVKRLAGIGTELFLLYTSLNSILVMGRGIVWELENGLNWLDRKATGEPDRELFTHIGFKLQQQQFLILQFIASFKRLALELQVIAPEVVFELAPLIFGKLNAVRFLLDAMSAQHLFSIADGRLQALMDLTAAKAEKVGPIKSPEQASDFAFEIQVKHRALFKDFIVDEGVGNLALIPAKQNHLIRAYLKRRKPQTELDAIEKVVKQLHETIANNFSLNDILLNVADKRCGVSDPFIGF
jgi:hypothetical protein